MLVYLTKVVTTKSDGPSSWYSHRTKTRRRIAQTIACRDIWYFFFDTSQDNVHALENVGCGQLLLSTVTILNGSSYQMLICWWTGRRQNMICVYATVPANSMFLLCELVNCSTAQLLKDLCHSLPPHYKQSW